MQKRTWWITIGLVSGALALVLVELCRQTEQGLPEPPSAPQSAAPSEADATCEEAGLRTSPSSKPAAPTATSRVDDAGPGAVVRVPAAQTLALVNGAPLTLKNLAGIPVAPAVVEQVLTPVMYDFLLNRA